MLWDLHAAGHDWYSIILAITCCMCLLAWWYSQLPKNLPPGPTGLPYLGNLITVVRKSKARDMLTYLLEQHEKYGPIISYKAGVQRFVIIKDGPTIAELYGLEECSIRPTETFPVLKNMTHGASRLGIVFANGESNKEMRRFALVALRDFGVGKSTLDEIIQMEASQLCQHLIAASKPTDGVLSSVKIRIQRAAANIIHHIIFGYRQEYDDPKWIALVQKLYDFFSINFLGFPENFLPFLGKIPAINDFVTQHQNTRFIEINNDLEKYIMSQIEDHRSTYCEGEIRDFIDLYIKHENEGREFYSTTRIFATILDIFRAGSETTANTLTFATMILTKRADIQKVLQEEIDEVLGRRPYARDEKDKLIKTRAFVYELHRYVSVAHIAPPHSSDRPVNVKGYTIPAGSIIQANLYAMHHDESYWDAPEEFRIERWIDDNGELLKHGGHFYPFSTGKRMCPGRQLANSEVMIFLVEMLQNCTIEKAEGYPAIVENKKAGFLRTPPEFYFKLAQRV